MLLARPLWAEVMAVRGDEGARSVIRAHPEAVLRVALPGRPPGDVDTPADYRLLRDAADDEEVGEGNRATQYTTTCVY